VLSCKWWGLAQQWGWGWGLAQQCVSNMTIVMNLRKESGHHPAVTVWAAVALGLVHMYVCKMGWSLQQLE
jgi:hypothetical protein